jgi:hypothetical protein
VRVVVLMNAAVGVAVALRVGRAGRHRRFVVVIVTMLVWMAMYRAVRMSMLFTFDLRLARATAAYGTHRSVSRYSISISLTRISVPPVACT